MNQKQIPIAMIPNKNIAGNQKNRFILIILSLRLNSSSNRGKLFLQYRRQKTEKWTMVNGPNGHHGQQWTWLMDLMDTMDTMDYGPLLCP